MYMHYLQLTRIWLQFSWPLVLWVTFLCYSFGESHISRAYIFKKKTCHDFERLHNSRAPKCFTCSRRAADFFYLIHINFLLPLTCIWLLCYIILYYILLYCIIVSYIVLYYIMLYYVILYYVKLYCVILYCFILCYTILYCVMLYIVL